MKGVHALFFFFFFFFSPFLFWKVRLVKEKRFADTKAAFGSHMYRLKFCKKPYHGSGAKGIGIGSIWWPPTICVDTYM